MYVYIHTLIYTCIIIRDTYGIMYVYTHILSTYIHTCIILLISICMYIHILMLDLKILHQYVSIYIYIHILISICMYVYTYTYINMYVYTYTYVRSEDPIHTHIVLNIHTCKENAGIAHSDCLLRLVYPPPPTPTLIHSCLRTHNQACRRKKEGGGEGG